MTILYKYVQGSQSIPGLAILLGVAAVICIACTVAVFVVKEWKTGIWLTIITIWIGMLCYVNAIDTRRIIVKAIINDTVSWKEINSKYKLLNQEGEIYIFEVKDDDDFNDTRT